MDIVKLLLASEYFSEILKETGLDRTTLVKILIKIYPEFIGLEEEFAHKEVPTTNLQQVDETVLQTKPQPVAPKVTQNHYTLFAQPAESSQIASYVEVMPKTQNYHSFLVEQGFTKQKIKELREQAKQQSKESRPIASRPKTAVVSSTSWCNGLLDTDMAKIKPIGGQDTKSPNCFLYLDSQSLQEQGCKQLALFENLSLKFCAEQNEQGLKSLKGNLLNIRAVIGDKIDNYALTHEIKIKGNASRILCFPILSDDGRSTLYIGAVFAKQGLHDKHVTKKYKLDSKVIVIDLPEQPKLEQARSLRLN